MHGKDDIRRGVCFSPQKGKLLVVIAFSEENQGYLMKKKLNEDIFDFLLTNYATITWSKLVYQKVTQNLGLNLGDQVKHFEF